MQVKKTNPSPTQAVLTVIADEAELAAIKAHVLTHFQSKVKVPGFRAGKVPAELLEKHVDAATLQSEFLEEAIEQLYVSAAREHQLRPVDRPQISVKKFVPFTTLEFEATVEVLDAVTLPDYTKIRKTKPTAGATDADVKEVIESLRARLGEKKDVSRTIQDGDQVFIDFKGVDAKTKDPIAGADGKDYPLTLGSNTFIPGFEPELVGLKAGEEKTFTITFPKDYGMAALQNRKVSFTVSIIKVQEVVLPKADDEFAAKAGPFKSLADLKADIKKQLAAEKQNKSDRDFESELVKEISGKSKLAIPQILIADQINRLWTDLQQNIVYRGMTIQEFLSAEGKTEEEYRNQVLQPQAEDRVKASLVLAEIAEKEKLDVTPEELEIRIQILKGQYQDAKMQAELDKPEARQDIAARLLTEKAVNKLVAHATGK
ncbi:MAG TPA: trigger factor [Candidatus Limnocylindria bacterium]|nr:trigger factor [Candidatus Limnocylindria bacterium]